MKKFSKWLLPFFFILFAASCSSALKDKGSIKLTLPSVTKNNSRSAELDAYLEAFLEDGMIFTITVKGETLAEDIVKKGISGDTILIEDLYPGEYLITCEGKFSFNNDLEEGQEYLCGQTTAVVIAGEVASAKLSLEWKYDEPDNPDDDPTKGDTGELEGETFELQTIVDDNQITARWLNPYGAKKVTLVLCPYSNDVASMEVDEETGDVIFVPNLDMIRESTAAVKKVFERNSDNKWTVNSYTFTNVERENGYFVALYAEDEDSEIVNEAVSEMLLVYATETEFSATVISENKIYISWNYTKPNSTVHYAFMRATEGKSLSDYVINDFTEFTDDTGMLSGGNESNPITTPGTYVVGIYFTDGNNEVYGFECKFVEIKAETTTEPGNGEGSGSGEGTGSSSGEGSGSGSGDGSGTGTGSETTKNVTVEYKNGTYEMNKDCTNSDFIVKVDGAELTSDYSVTITNPNGYGPYVPVTVDLWGDSPTTYTTTIPVNFVYPEIGLVYNTGDEGNDTSVTIDGTKDYKYAQYGNSLVSLYPFVQDVTYTYYAGTYTNSVTINTPATGLSFYVIKNGAPAEKIGGDNATFCQVNYSDIGNFEYYCVLDVSKLAQIPGISSYCTQTTVQSAVYKGTVCKWEIEGFYKNSEKLADASFESGSRYSVRIKNQAGVTATSSLFWSADTANYVVFDNDGTISSDGSYYEKYFTIGTVSEEATTNIHVKIGEYEILSATMQIEPKETSGAGDSGEYLTLGDTAPTSGKYAINSVDDFIKLNSWTQASFENVTFVLTDDIDLQGKTTTGYAILNGYSNYPFKGTFDGNGKKIKNITLEKAQDALGLFGYIGSGAVIKNLTIEGNISNNSSGSFIGGIAGKCIGDAEITNCINKANVTAGSCNGVGGFVGGVTGGTLTISNCINEGVIKGYSRSGGIIGETRGSGCSDSTSSSGKAVVTNCANLNTVTVDTDYAGGIIGVCDTSSETYYPSISYCLNYGVVTDSLANNTDGAIMGGNYLQTDEFASSTYIKDCYYVSTSNAKAIGTVDNSVNTSITVYTAASDALELINLGLSADKQWSIKTVTIGENTIQVPLF